MRNYQFSCNIALIQVFLINLSGIHLFIIKAAHMIRISFDKNWPIFHSNRSSI